MSEAVYSAAQVAKMLGVSGGMVRRYAMALETLTGEQIPQHPRDGRQFSQENMDTLVSARRFVVGRQGMSVKTGLRLALGLAELPATVNLSPNADSGDLVGVEALRTALSEYMGPLLTELRTLSDSNSRLSDEVAALRLELAEVRVLSGAERPAAVEDGGGVAESPATGQGVSQAIEDGPAVRAVRWLERRIRGSRG
jgi:hypothetical protein